ncbi:MAG: hypothetical protein ABII71_03470 [Candidatus Micrarchaeota archaeon]
MDGEVYASLDKGWKAACRVLFGQELGDLKEYDGWLSEYYPMPSARKSCVSGKDVFIDSDFYGRTAKFVSSEEAQANPEALTINEIKDIDSIMQAVSEKWRYTGNKILGNSAFVSNSDLIMDSQNVLDSANIYRSSYVHKGNSVRKGAKYVFSGGYMGISEFVMRAFAVINSKRIFESSYALDCSDTYLSHNVSGCSDTIFCFFVKRKRNCIGNKELPRQQYLELKKKLLAEIGDELKKNKRFPSLFELYSQGSPNEYDFKIPERQKPDGPEKIEKAFATTCRMLLGREISGLEKHAKWLCRNRAETRDEISCLGREVIVPTGQIYDFFNPIPRKRLVTYEEGLAFGTEMIDGKVPGSIRGVVDATSGFAVFTPEVFDGRLRNIIKTPIGYNTIDSYKDIDATYSENTAFTTMSGNNKNVFGSGWFTESEFCINCYNSINLSRCFEMDTSEKCSDAYFCHNSEGLVDAMFCFNAKGKRNAIGNLSLDSAKYLETKKALLHQFADELEEKGELSIDIFSMGGKGGKGLWHPKLTRS